MKVTEPLNEFLSWYHQFMGTTEDITTEYAKLRAAYYAGYYAKAAVEPAPAPSHAEEKRQEFARIYDEPGPTELPVAGRFEIQSPDPKPRNDTILPGGYGYKRLPAPDALHDAHWGGYLTAPEGNMVQEPYVNQAGPFGLPAAALLPGTITGRLPAPETGHIELHHTDTVWKPAPTEDEDFYDG